MSNVHEVFAQQKSHLATSKLSPAEERRLLELAARGIDPEDDDE